MEESRSCVCTICHDDETGGSVDTAIRSSLFDLVAVVVLHSLFHVINRFLRFYHVFPTGSGATVAPLPGYCSIGNASDFVLYSPLLVALSSVPVPGSVAGSIAL